MFGVRHGLVPEGNGWFVLNARDARWGDKGHMFGRAARFEGECLLLVEGQERRLRRWDFVHCLPWAEHVFVGAGDRPCAILMIGGRRRKGVVYPVAEVATRHGAGVSKETRNAKEAYSRFRPGRPALAERATYRTTQPAGRASGWAR